MNNLNLIKLFASFSVVAFSVVACAGDTEEPTDGVDGEEPTEEVAATEADLTGGGCKSKAQYIAHANRVCGPSNYTFHYNKAVTRYRRGGEWKHCAPNSYVSLPHTCK